MITAETTGNNTTNHNGTEWYTRGDASMGFAPGGATISLSSADITNDEPTNAYRMSWHTSGGSIYSGYRAGNEYPHEDWTRYVYQSNTLPTYYPSGPQIDISGATVTNGGWSLCWSGTFDQGKSISDLFNTDCTSTYLLYTAGPTLNNTIYVGKNMRSVLMENGGAQKDVVRLYAGDNLDLDLRVTPGNSSTGWSHFKVYKSNCVVSTSCWPGNPVDNPENWDSGTSVTNNTYTIPSNAELEHLYVYQADDQSDTAITAENSVRLEVSHTPVERTISSCEDLILIDNEVDVFQYQDIYKLTQDIDCTGVDLEYGLDFDGPFEGTFDGQGHTISNVNIDAPEDYYIGLFRRLNGATIKNLTLSNGTMTGAYKVGALAGEAYDTTLTNIHSNLNVNASDVYGYYSGGLIGYYEIDYNSATISNVSSTGDVYAYNGYAGGLIGDTEVYGYTDEDVELTIEKAFYNGNVSANESYVGGLMGYAYVENEDDGYEPARLIIHNSYSQGSVNSDNGYDAGGLIGYAEAYNDEYDSIAEIIISESYSSASVVAEDYVAGLIGELDIDYVDERTSILNSFAAGNIEARNGASYAITGGTNFADNDGEFTMDNVFFDETSTNQSYPVYAEIGGATGVNGDDSNPDYFKNNSTNPPLNIWDFTNIWKTNENDYPTFNPVSDETINELDLSSAEDGTTMLLEQDGCTGFGEFSTVKESSLSVSDSTYSYPKGLVSFELVGCDNGGQATISLTTKGTYDLTKIIVRKYNTVTKTYTTLTQANSNLTSSSATIEGQPGVKITYTITDGGELDQDGVANGVIVDPVGLALQTVSVPNTGFGRR